MLWPMSAVTYTHTHTYTLWFSHAHKKVFSSIYLGFCVNSTLRWFLWLKNYVRTVIFRRIDFTSRRSTGIFSISTSFRLFVQRRSVSFICYVNILSIGLSIYTFIKPFYLDYLSISTTHSFYMICFSKPFFDIISSIGS